MKGCTVAFNIVGMVVTSIYCSIYIATFIRAGMTGYVFLFAILLILSILCGIAALVSLARDSKSVGIGVMCLLFNGLVGGILYLCWRPYISQNTKVYETKEYGLYSNNRNTNIVKQNSKIAKPTTTLEEKADLLKKYKDLLDSGAIDKEEFDNIKSQIFNDEVNLKAHVALKNNNTTIPEFNTSPYKTALESTSIDTSLIALKDFSKGDLNIVKSGSYRYYAHYGNTYQVIVNEQMLNLSESEFVYIFFQQ